jgi:hypothetical protein
LPWNPRFEGASRQDWCLLIMVRRAFPARDGVPVREIARSFNVHHATISRLQ